MLAAAVLLVGSLGLATAARGVGTAWSLADTSAYVPAGPARLADTRTGAGFDRIDSRTVRVAVAGRAGVPTTAVAAVLTVTVTDTSAGGYVSVWPAGGARPTVSTLNTDSAGQTVANAVTVRLGADGAVDLYTSAVASLVVDVVGAYVPAARARAGRFVPVRPSRLADTRPWRGPLGPGERLAVPLGAGVPDDATAVVVNLTVDQSVGAGFWSAFAAAGAPPLASVLNTDGPGQTRAALTIVPLAGRAAIELFAQTGGHAIVDLVGWFTGDSATEATTGLFVPVAPRRLIDTRSDASPLAPGGSVRAHVPHCVLAVSGNLTTTDGLGGGYLTAFPESSNPESSNPGSPPAGRTSSVNFGPGQTVANQLIAAAEGGLVIEVAGSPTQVVLDVTGYYVRAPDPGVTDDPGASASGRFAPSVAAVTLTSVPADVIVPTSRESLAPRTNPINGRRGGAHPVPAGVGCAVDPAAPRDCLLATLDALGFNVVGGSGVDRQRRLHQAVAVVQLDAGFTATGMADRPLYEYLGIWPGSNAFGADEVRTVGRSQQGRPIVALRFGRGSKVTMVVGETHGDEEAGLRVVLLAVRQQRPVDETLWVVPLANPDGLALDTRFLANGADPNRASPSQPEQRALLEFARGVRPTNAVYYHQNYGWIGGSGASMLPAATYQAVVHLGALNRSGNCATSAFLWCPIDDAVGSSSVLVELPDVVTPAVVHDHVRALLAVAAG